MRMGVVGMSKTLSSELGKDNILINVIGPALSGRQSDHGRRHSYELKVARRVVQKYSGTMATEPRGELFAVKIVMPLTRG